MRSIAIIGASLFFMACFGLGFSLWTDIFVVFLVGAGMEDGLQFIHEWHVLIFCGL